MTDYSLFADESCQNGHDYMAYAALLLTDRRVSELKEQLRAIKAKHGITAQMKWGRVSAGKYGAYKELADAILDGVQQQHLVFHSVLVDATQLNHRQYNRGDRELTFQKFYYQLLVKCGRLHAQRETDRVHANLHQRETVYEIDELKKIVNNGLARRRWRLQHNPYRAARFIESRGNEILQATDIFLGAVSATANGHINKPNASNSKKNLVDHVCARRGLNSLAADTPYGHRFQFTVWNIQLQ